jgi:hypothetical protein
MNLPDFDDFAPDRDKQFCSMGFVCQLLQILPGQLRVLMEDCEIKFSQVVDGIGFLSVADTETVAKKCRDIRKEICETIEATPNN